MHTAVTEDVWKRLLRVTALTAALVVIDQPALCAIERQDVQACSVNEPPVTEAGVPARPQEMVGASGLRDDGKDLTLVRLPNEQVGVGGNKLLSQSTLRFPSPTGTYDRAIMETQLELLLLLAPDLTTMRDRRRRSSDSGDGRNSS